MSVTNSPEMLAKFAGSLSPSAPEVSLSCEFYTPSIEQSIKRVIDIAVACVGLVIISPLLTVIALLIKLTSEGPILYKSIRTGKDLKPFTMYKFRTMHNNADRLWAELKEKQIYDGELFKIKRDPRVIPVGFFLRKYSLDELPQLFNVIKGDMSLVGPRPFLQEESKMFEENARVRFNVLPGMTGLWQTSGRSDLNFKQLCSLDINYVVTWSLWADFRILLRTVPTVLFSKGAY